MGEIKYLGSGNYDAIVDFIEGTVRKGECTLAFPENCPEEERAAMKEIEKLTVEYIAKLKDFGIDKPEEYSTQTMMKFGIKNPFKVDYDDVYFEQDEEDEADIYEMR